MTPAAPVTLPRDVVSEKTREGVRYKLPRRNLGKVRLIGLVPVAFGVAIAAIPINIMAGAFRDVFTKPNLFHAFAGIFLLVFLFAALKPIQFGMLALFGRCTIILTREWLRVVDSAGPFRHVRKARRDDVRRFEVKSGKMGSAPGIFAPLAHLGALEAHFDWSKAMPLAIGYPREWLVTLGDELTAQLSEANLVQARPALPPTAEVVKDLSAARISALHTEDVLVQPKISTARMESTAEAVTIVLPPRGVFRGSKGLLTFGLLWCAFMTLFTAVVLFANTSGSRTGFAVFITLFWTIGIAMILGAVNSGRRRGLLMAATGELRVAQQSLFGKKVWAWSRDQIAAIRADHSGVEINNRPVIDLQVHAIDGRKTGLFSGRDEMELQWIATVLRQKLNVPPTIAQVSEPATSLISETES